MTHNTKIAYQQLEAQRWQASQAGREVANWQQASWANALERAGELVLAGRRSDSRRVLQLALEAK